MNELEWASLKILADQLPHFRILGRPEREYFIKRLWDESQELPEAPESERTSSCLTKDEEKCEDKGIMIDLLRADIAAHERYESFLMSCVRSGEHTEMTFSDFRKDEGEIVGDPEILGCICRSQFARTGKHIDGCPAG